jgi:hypothetical protein
VNFLISGVLSLINNAEFDLTFCGLIRAAIQSLRDVLDELEEERQEFARDTGLEVDDEEFRDRRVAIFDHACHFWARVAKGIFTDEIGGQCRTRTCDLLLVRQAL